MEQKYISGLFVFAPNPKAPDFVKARLSVSPESLSKWLEENKGLANEKGFIAIDVLEGKDGKWYAKVNDFKPTQKSVVETANDGDLDLSDIPF